MTEVDSVAEILKAELVRLKQEFIAATTTEIAVEIGPEPSADSRYIASSPMRFEYQSVGSVFDNLIMIVGNVGQIYQFGGDLSDLQNVAGTLQAIHPEYGRPIGIPLASIWDWIARLASTAYSIASTVASAGGDKLAPHAPEFYNGLFAEQLSASKISIDAIVALEAREDVLRVHGEVKVAEKEIKAKGASARLTKNFDSVARSEKVAAEVLRVLAVVTFLVALYVVIQISKRVNELSWTELTAKALIEIPLLGLAYYFSSDSRDHRNHSRRAADWQVRINTIDAYTEPLPKLDREKIRTDMGRAIYREPKEMKEAPVLADTTKQAIEQFLTISKALKENREEG